MTWRPLVEQDFDFARCLALRVLKSPPHSPKATRRRTIIGAIRCECLDGLSPLSASHSRTRRTLGDPLQLSAPRPALRPGVPAPPLREGCRAPTTTSRMIWRQERLCARDQFEASCIRCIPSRLPWPNRIFADHTVQCFMMTGPERMPMAGDSANCFIKRPGLSAQILPSQTRRVVPFAGWIC
jgi:hypothetical protein